MVFLVFIHSLIFSVVVVRVFVVIVVAFVSAIYLRVPLHPTSTEESIVLHTGLTCVSPALRRQGLVAPLFYHIFAHLSTRPEFADGLWVTSRSTVPSALGNIAHCARNVFPSPDCLSPSATHLQIARVVDERYFSGMLVSPTARFNEETFVIEGADSPDSCLWKDMDDPQYHHRDPHVNEFYRRLLGKDEGNEILQVGFLDWTKLRTLKKIWDTKLRFDIQVRTFSVG